MMVYLAYVMVILHVITGVVQLEHSSVYLVLTLGGVITLSFLHILAARKERRADATIYKQELNGFHKICSVHEIPVDRAVTACLEKERIAIFRYDNKISAVSNVCKHQNGPLGEGKIIDGCITCPWHGYQYKPQDGRAPSPFKEKLKTFEVKIIDNNVWVNPSGFEEGTFVTPATIEQR
jgi:methionine sulfoxide reductase heme-binding subunit